MPKRTRTGSIKSSYKPRSAYARRKKYRTKRRYRYKRRSTFGGKGNYSRPVRSKFRRTKYGQKGASLVPWLNPSGNLPRYQLVKLHATHQFIGTHNVALGNTRAGNANTILNSLLNPFGTGTEEPLNLALLQPLFRQYQVIATKVKVGLVCPVTNFPVMFQTRVCNATSVGIVPNTWAEAIQARDIKYTYISNYTVNTPQVTWHKHYVKHDKYQQLDDDNPGLRGILTPTAMTQPTEPTYLEWAFQNGGNDHAGNTCPFNIIIRCTYYVKLHMPSATAALYFQQQAT